MICIFGMAVISHSWHLTYLHSSIIMYNHSSTLMRCTTICLPDNNVPSGRRKAALVIVRIMAGPLLRHSLEIQLVQLGSFDMADCHIWLVHWVRHRVTNICAPSLVFASPVYRTENIHRTELNWTMVQSFSSIWGQSSCQLPCFCKCLKTEKDWFRLVATGLLSCYMSDLTHAYFYLISGPWII